MDKPAGRRFNPVGIAAPMPPCPRGERGVAWINPLDPDNRRAFVSGGSVVGGLAHLFADTPEPRTNPMPRHAVPATTHDKGPDQGLLAWGRATAARRRGVGPVLWLFTDTRRLPDPVPAARRLPRGIAGVVLRHDDHPDRARIGRDLARVCRQRRLALVVAGDTRLAARLGAGVHLRGGAWPSPLRRPGIITSSAHDPAQLIRARRNGAALAFLSPAFPTASHPGAPGLGCVRWTSMARRAGIAVAALGGIDGIRVHRLGHCAGAAAIGALASG